MAYKSCCENKWMDDVSSHMIEIIKPKNYWTKERCFESALEYNSIKEFKKNSPQAYNLCLKNKYINDACSHMEKLGNLFMKVGYKMIFTSKLNTNEYIYIGLTCDFNRRIYEHLNRVSDNLYNSIIKYELVYKESFIYHDYLSAEDSKIMEIKSIDFYKNDVNFILLNKSIGGEGLRGKYELYTKEICEDILKNYNSVSDAINGNKKVYNKALQKGWLSEIAPHIKIRKYKNGFYTKKENCLELSKLCNNLDEFRKSYHRAYLVSKENNWLIDFFDNIDINKKPIGHWLNIENCRSVASECKNRHEFQKKYSGAYFNSFKNNWLDYFFPKNI
jgi:hypothetical protein